MDHITQIGAIALWILAILIPVQLYIGYRVAGKSGTDAEHYFISGKQLPLFLVFMADFATAFGVGGFIGYSGKGYSIGLGQFWMLLGEQGTKFLFAIFLAGMIGKYAYTTINEFLEKEMFHDKWLRAMGGIVMAIPLVCTVGAQAIGIGTLLSVVMGVDVVTGIWIAALTAILYTVMGGMWALAWTDLLQGIIRVVIGCIFFGLVLWSAHGIGGLRSSVLATRPDLWNFGSIGPFAALSLVLAPLAGQFTHQAWWQRCFAAKDSKTARNGYFLTAVFCSIMFSLSILTGIFVHTMNPDLARPDMAFPWLMNNWLNPILAAFLVVTIIGADMTLSAGFLNSGVTLLLMDVIKPLIIGETTGKKLVKWARCLTFVLGVLVVWVALTFPSVLGAVLFGYAVGGGGLFIPLVLGLLWKDGTGQTRVTKNAAMASLVCGGGIVVIFELTPSLFEIFGGGIIPGICASLLVTVGISLLENSTNQNKPNKTAVG